MTALVVDLGDKEPPHFGSDGNGLDALKDDPAVKANAPSGGYRKHGFDTAHLTRYAETNLVQWVGRRRDGYFYPWGSLMRITAAGLRALATSRTGATTPLSENTAAASHSDLVVTRGVSPPTPASPSHKG